MELPSGQAGKVHGASGRGVGHLDGGRRAGECEQGESLGCAGAEGGGSSRLGGVWLLMFKASALLWGFAAFSGGSSDSGR